MTAIDASRETTRRPRRGGGFTLVELVAVMIIAGILAGVAVVTLSSAAGNRSRMAANQLRRDLTFARQRAVATGTPSWVQLNITAETWSILAEDPVSAGTGWSDAAIINDPATGQPFVQTVGVAPFNGVDLLTVGFDGNDKVKFGWLGKPRTYNGAAETALAADGDVTLSGGHTVRVKAETGHIVLNP